jgi:hypothetical protein
MNKLQGWEVQLSKERAPRLKRQCEYRDQPERWAISGQDPPAVVIFAGLCSGEPLASNPIFGVSLQVGTCLFGSSALLVAI